MVNDILSEKENNQKEVCKQINGESMYLVLVLHLSKKNLVTSGYI